MRNTNILKKDQEGRLMQSTGGMNAKDKDAIKNMELMQLCSNISSLNIPSYMANIFLFDCSSCFYC